MSQLCRDFITPSESFTSWMRSCGVPFMRIFWLSTACYRSPLGRTRQIWNLSPYLAESSLQEAIFNVLPDEMPRSVEEILMTASTLVKSNSMYQHLLKFNLNDCLHVIIYSFIHYISLYFIIFHVISCHFMSFHVMSFHFISCLLKSLLNNQGFTCQAS